MKDPSRNPALDSSFSFTGTIVDVAKTGKIMQVMVQQDVAGRLPTDYKLIIPAAALGSETFPYTQGDTVMVLDALLYTKNAETRLRISSMDQLRSTTARPGELNTLSFSGEIVEIKEGQGYDLVYLKQTYEETYTTILEVLFPKSLLEKMERQPKVGDIGYIKSAILYEKIGSFRAKISRPTYKCLYTPDVVMYLGTIEAKEKFI